MSGNEDDGRDRFADLFGEDPGTRRIDSKKRAPAQPKPGKRRAKGDGGAPAGAPADDPDALVDDGFRGEIPPRQFTDLRMGRIPHETRIDLHGLDRTQARHALRKSFGLATAQGQTCVLVIHGKGRGSATADVTLKSALPGWLRSPPLDAWVRGFAPALPRDGGDGATYVLLRRNAPAGATGPRGRAGR